MTKKLENKVVIVTGANSGIGLATAKLFAAEGAHVYITGRRKEQLDAAAAEIGGSVTAVNADSTKMADLDRLFAQVKADHGRLDAIVVNAGGGSVLPLGQITEEPGAPCDPQQMSFEKVGTCFWDLSSGSPPEQAPCISTLSGCF